MFVGFKFGSIRHEFQKVVSGSVRIVSFSISVIHTLTPTYPFPPHPNPLIHTPLSSTHLHSYPHLQFKLISIGALSRLYLKILIWNWLYLIQFFKIQPVFHSKTQFIKRKFGRNAKSVQKRIFLRNPPATVCETVVERPSSINFLVQKKTHLLCFSVLCLC